MGVPEYIPFTVTLREYYYLVLARSSSVCHLRAAAACLLHAASSCSLPHQRSEEQAVVFFTYIFLLFTLPPISFAPT